MSRPPSPALVTAHAARRLPRWVPWLLIAVYVLPGFIGRDPWRGDDLTSFGVMMSLLDGGSWWRPAVLGQPVGDAAWLPYWLGALGMVWLPLAPEIGARLPFIALLLATLAATWYGTYRLARQPGAQPVALAFGGDAPPRDYARALADGALLALVATLGLALLSHETTPTAARLGFAALLMYGVIQVLDRALCGQATSSASDGRATSGMVLWSVAGWGLAWSGAPWINAVLTVAGLVWWMRLGGLRREPGALVLTALGSFGGTALAVWLALRLGLPGAGLEMRWAVWLEPSAWRSLGRLFTWFLWPAAVFALWTLWRWRGRWREPHIGWPATVALVLLLATLAEGGDERTLLLTLPAMAMLAAFALPTLGRSLNALIDWFAVVFFTGAAAIIWIIWIAMQTGVPAKPAANVARMAPAFQPSFDWHLWLPALAATLAWFGIVVWRVGRHRPALWKGLTLSAAGITLNWLLLMTLWLPLLNHGFGQAPISQRIAALVPQGDCVLVHGLNASQIAGLQHHGQLHLRRTDDPLAGTCDWLVVVPAAFVTLRSAVALDDWSLRTEVPRLRENREKWLVFERRRFAAADRTDRP